MKKLILFLSLSAIALAGYAQSTLTLGRGLTGSSYNTTSNVTATIDTNKGYTWLKAQIFNPAVSGTNYGAIFTPAQTASANNQSQIGVHIAPTYSDGSFTGVLHLPLALDWDATSHFVISDIIGPGTITMHTFATPTTANYFFRSDGVSTFFNAPNAAGNIYFRINNSTGLQMNNAGVVSILNIGKGVVNSSLAGALSTQADGTANQVFGMNSAATGYEYKTVSGSSATGLTVTNGTGTITLSNDTTKLQTIANFFPKGDTRYANLTGTQTLTNKTISGSSNTITNIGNSSLTNSTISGIALGGTLGTLSQGTGITSFSYTGASAATVAINQAFAPTWTGVHTFSPSVTGANFGTIFSPTQAASANNQQITTLHIAPAYTDGSFTGLVHVPIQVDWDTFSHFTVSDVTGQAEVDLSAYANPTTANYFLRANGLQTFFNAPTTSGTLFFRVNNTTEFTIGPGGTLTAAAFTTKGLLANSSTGLFSSVADGTANQVLGMNSAGTGYEYKTISGSSSTGLAVTNGAGTLTVSNDTTVLQTIANLFPKGDTRYLKTATAASIYQPLLGYTAANDANVVHKTGNETVAGTKVFTGTLAIGTTTVPPGFQFAVNGSTIATSITVKAQTNWPDYVFLNQYQLMPLPDLANYVRNNHHLPDMPAAAEIARNGQDLGDLNTKLVKKVEELTLYLIEKDKQLNQQKATIAAQEERLKRIEKQLNTGSGH